MTDYIDLLLEEQLERQEREEGDGTWNGDAVQVPIPQEEQTERVHPTDDGTALAPEQTGTDGGFQRQTGAEEPAYSASDKEESVGTAERAARRELGEAMWTVRRWLTGQTGMGQAGMRTEENGVPNDEASRTDLPTDMPWIGQSADGEGMSYSGGVGQTSGEWEQLRQAAGSGSLDRVSRSTGAGWLDRAVRISLEGLPAPDRESKVVTLEPAEWNGGAGRLELRQLDRLVRRDARRFDGGFQLL